MCNEYLLHVQKDLFWILPDKRTTLDILFFISKYICEYAVCQPSSFVLVFVCFNKAEGRKELKFVC